MFCIVMYLMFLFGMYLGVVLMSLVGVLMWMVLCWLS